MRTPLALALGSTIILSGCGTLDGFFGAEPKPAAYTKPVSERWMLITPPDRLTVTELRESLERLPGSNDALPPPSGEVEVSRYAVEDAYETLRTAPSANDQVAFLVEESVDRNAPVITWNQVREFDSEERCRQIQKDLQEVTKGATREVVVERNMELWRMQWLFLEWSNRWSQCVPLAMLEGPAPTSATRAASK